MPGQRRAQRAVQLLGASGLGNEAVDLTLVDQPADDHTVALLAADQHDHVRLVAAHGTDQVHLLRLRTANIGDQHSHFLACQVVHGIADIAGAQELAGALDRRPPLLNRTRVVVEHQHSFMEGLGTVCAHRVLKIAPGCPWHAGHLGGNAHGFKQLLVVPWFRHEAKHLAVVDRTQHRIEVGITREQEPGAARRHLAHALQKLGAGHAGHALIADDHVKVFCAEQGESVKSAAGHGHFVLTAQQPAQGTQQAGFVVDAQHLGQTMLAHGRATLSRGNRTRNSVPKPTSLLTSMSPPCSCTMSRAIASPRPVPSPLALVVK